MPPDANHLLLLKYYWTSPLALEYQVPGIEFKDIVHCVNELPPPINYRDSAIFKEQVYQKWNCRIKYVLSYIPHHKFCESLEAWEHHLMHKFLNTKNMIEILGMLYKYIYKFNEKCKSYLTFFYFKSSLHKYFVEFIFLTRYF